VTISDLRFVERDQGNTFAMTDAQLNNAVSSNIKPKKPASINFQGTWKATVGKTGLFIEISNSNTNQVIYSNNWFSSKDSYKSGDTYSKTIQWLFPTTIPSALYEVTVTLRDWVNPSLPGFASITFKMAVNDIS